MVTRQKFARRLLKGLDAPHDRRTTGGRRNMRALVAWMQAEGSPARFNPFATTLPMPGATIFNDHGVRHYRSLDDGVAATVKTLKTGEEFGYRPIIHHLRNGVRAEDTLEAVAASRWGTGHLSLEVLRSWIGHPERYDENAAKPIGQ